MTLTPHPMTKHYRVLKGVMGLSIVYGVLGLIVGGVTICGGLFMFTPTYSGTMTVFGTMVVGASLMVSALFSFGFAQLIELVFEIRETL